jgi:hypothetical protein
LPTMAAAPVVAKCLDTRLVSVAGSPLAASADPFEWITTTAAPHASMTEFAIQHGTHMAALEVCICPDPRDHVACDAAITWLCESLSASVGGVVGMDAEGGSRNATIQVLQFATDTRCVLVLLQGAARPLVLSSHIVALLQSRDIYKAGAELWTDAIDVWSMTRGRTLVNGCLDLNFDDGDRRERPSLAALCNQALGADEAFCKDKETTCSDWSRRQLTWRQLIYAALDAQASHYAAVTLTTPEGRDARRAALFHLGDVRADLLARVTVWKAELRLQETVVEQLKRVRVDVSHIEALADDCIVVHCAGIVRASVATRSSGRVCVAQRHRWLSSRSNSMEIAPSSRRARSVCMHVPMPLQASPSRARRKARTRPISARLRA